MDLWTQFRRLLLVSGCSAEDDMATHGHALRRRVQIANISDRRPLRNGPHITAGPHVHFHIADEAEVHGEVYRPASGCCESFDRARTLDEYVPTQYCSLTPVSYDGKVIIDRWNFKLSKTKMLAVYSFAPGIALIELSQLD